MGIIIKIYDYYFDDKIVFEFINVLIVKKFLFIQVNNCVKSS